MELELPLPPSANAAFMNGKYGNRFNKPETNIWYDTAIILVKNWMRKNKVEPFTDWTYCDMQFFLRRRGADTHNYLKVYNDGLQKAGLIENDSFLLNRIQDVQYDSKNPRIIATFTKKE